MTRARDKASAVVANFASTGIDDNADANAITIDSSENVMIGTTTEGLADYADTLTVADTDHAGITIRSGASSSGSLYFSDATSGSGEYDGYLNYNQSTQKLTVGTAAATRMTIDSSGRVTKPNQVAFAVTPSHDGYISTSPIAFGNAQLNTGNHFNTTNYTFTAPIDGRYLLHMHLGIVRILSANATAYPRLQVNGANTQYSYVQLPAATGYVNANITAVLNLSANDTVKVTFTGTNSDYYGGQHECIFSGYLLG